MLKTPPLLKNRLTKLKKAPPFKQKDNSSFCFLEWYQIVPSLFDW